jgi:hypothetical protein
MEILLFYDKSIVSLLGNGPCFFFSYVEFMI